jgi:dihydrofolate reductase
MAGPTSIEGYAIISADGMLADANRHIPDGLKIEADQTFFQNALDHAAVIVHGRHSHEGGPRADSRHRLVLTTRIAAIEVDRRHPKSLLWNPRGATLSEAWAQLGAASGELAVIGGPDVYGLFLEIGYDAFHLSHAPKVQLPGGRPVFPEIGPDRSADDVLASHGLKPTERRVLDANADATLVTWRR